MVAGVYLLLGPEKGLKEEHIKKIKASLGDCEVSKFYGFEDYEAEFYAQLNNNDLFANHKLVILEQAQEIKSKDKIKALASYIKSPSDCATLIISSENLFIEPEIMSAVPEIDTLKFYEMFESKKEEWLRNFFRKNSFSIDTAACTAIIEKVENNIHDFENVCSQLVIYMSTIEGKSTITANDVEDYLVHTREETDFSLFSYVARCKLSSALDCLHTLLRTKDASSVTAMCASRLATYFRRALSVQVNAQNGLGMSTSAREDGRAFSTKYFENDKPISRFKDKEVYRDACKSYSLRDMERVLVTLAEYDIKIKECGTLLQQTMMEKCLIDVIKHKGRHAKPLEFASL